MFSIPFADDTSVFLEGTDCSKIMKTLNNELEKVTKCKWSNANRLTVNINKSHYMVFYCAKFNNDNDNDNDNHNERFI